MLDHLTAAQARRVALRAQGLDRRRPARATPAGMAQFLGVVDRLGVLQIDSVNVLARAHLMPAFARIGAYDPALLDRASSRPPRRLVEAWAHQASFVTPETFRLLEWRRRAFASEAWAGIATVPHRHAAELDDVRALLRATGPMTAAQVHDALEHAPRQTVQWGWNWTVAKQALEYLFFTGEVTAAGRNAAFERRYDLTERVLPPGVLALGDPTEADAVRDLVEIGARAHGVATELAIADYFRIKRARVRPALAELVEAGVLAPVAVEGWSRPTYLHRDAVLPRRVDGRALLNPFDPLVFERERTEELFGLRYRIEIYVPEPQRVWGYYVLPFLLGDRLVALVDLKADRQAGVLRVHAAHPSGVVAPGVARVGRSEPDVVDELAAELAELAAWLRLDAVVVGDRTGTARGDLAAPLRATLVA